MRSTITALAFAVVTSSSAVAVAADYAAKGTVAATTSDLKMGFAGANGGKVVVPNAAGLYPLIVASHGFSANADNQVGWAEHWASYGFVVVAPTFPGGFSPDHAKNGQIIRDIVAGIDTLDSPAKGKVNKARVGLEGHSAGGLATTLAAAELMPSATVLFDPVDNGALGKGAYAKLCAPVVSLFAAPSMCNNNAGWFDFRTTAKGPTTSFRVKGSTHCDGENAPRSLCGFTCGGAADAKRQGVYARYATAFFLAHLKGDAEAAAALGSTALMADAAIGEVFVGGGPSCAPVEGDAGVVDSGPAPTDSGSATVDSGGTDSGVAAMDSGSADTAPSSESGTAPSAEPTGSDGGCSCTTPRAGGDTEGVLVLAALLVVRRRRALRNAR